ncbi:hypothetical protein ACB092_02G072800 [Castanea dentata]
MDTIYTAYLSLIKIFGYMEVRLAPVPFCCYSHISCCGGYCKCFCSALVKSTSTSKRATIWLSDLKGKRYWFPLMMLQIGIGLLVLQQLRDGNFAVKSGYQFLSALQEIPAPQPIPIVAAWRPLDASWYKINFDGALFVKENCAVVGVVIRNEQG